MSNSIFGSFSLRWFNSCWESHLRIFRWTKQATQNILLTLKLNNTHIKKKERHVVAPRQKDDQITYLKRIKNKRANQRKKGRKKNEDFLHAIQRDQKAEKNGMHYKINAEGSPTAQGKSVRGCNLSLDMRRESEEYSRKNCDNKDIKDQPRLARAGRSDRRRQGVQGSPTSHRVRSSEKSKGLATGRRCCCCPANGGDRSLLLLSRKWRSVMKTSTVTWTNSE